ncbi:MAG: hypothetical protein K8963_02750 [Proteobacteria bacterium]|nr:hypothetical protein [Pseudomonadota bacterium]
MSDVYLSVVGNFTLLLARLLARMSCAGAGIYPALRPRRPVQSADSGDSKLLVAYTPAGTPEWP